MPLALYVKDSEISSAVTCGFQTGQPPGLHYVM